MKNSRAETGGAGSANSLMIKLLQNGVSEKYTDNPPENHTRPIKFLDKRGDT
jgi:hypothetical protein